MSSLLDVSFQLETPIGFVELEDEANGYTLHKESFASRAVTHRKQEVTSEYVEGNYTTRAVRENVMEEVGIYVRGATPWEHKQRVDVVLGALEQLGYQAKVRFGDMLEVWECEIADYTIESPSEMRFATMCVVRAHIPRLPTMTVSQVVAP